MQNLEIKHRIDDPGAIRARLAGVPEVAPQWRRRQEDIYFHAPDRRIKIRIEDGGGAARIDYRRGDRAEARISDYTLTPLDDPHAAVADLTARHGLRGRVVKTRELLRFRNVRIHLDEVDGLGHFLEFESVIAEGITPDAAADNLAHISAALADLLGTPLAVGYADLLLSKDD